MAVHSYVEEVEKYLDSLKLQLEDEKRQIDDSKKYFSNLLAEFFQKDSCNESSKSVGQMKFSASSGSLLNSIFKDDEPDGFIFKNSNEQKRKQLAEERRAEYNSYLEKKEAELLLKRKRIDEQRNITPKSILEAVDYERILAKRREEEAKFRTLNHGDYLQSSNPNLNRVVETENLSNPMDNSSEQLLQRKYAPPDINQEKSNGGKSNLTFEINRLPVTKEPERSFSPKQIESLPSYRRTGGGGEPVKDSYGNLITARGFKNNDHLGYMNTIPLPSMEQSSSKIRINSYREELQRQIEEKKRLEALEKEKARQLEERIAQRIEEQRKQMQDEYEKELKKNNKMKQEFQRQQERIQMLEEFQRKDAEMRKKKFQESKPSNQLSNMNEEANKKDARSASPPVPAVRTKVILDKAVSPATTTQVMSEVKPENVFSCLAEIRRSIMQDQQKLKNNSKHSYEIMNRRTVQDVSDDEDEIMQISQRPESENEFENYKHSVVP